MNNSYKSINKVISFIFIFFPFLLVTGPAIPDIFVSLSDNIQETFGLTPLEGMASGLPVVATDWNGYRDYEPENVMNKFKKLCLNPQNNSFLKELKAFLIDIPWEIIIISKLLLAYAKSIKRKCLNSFPC